MLAAFGVRRHLLSRRPSPSAATIGRVLAALDGDALDRAVSAYLACQHRQRVPEGKVAKNRLHLDVRVGTGPVSEKRLATLEAEYAQLIALGAVRVRLLPA